MAKIALIPSHIPARLRKAGISVALVLLVVLGLRFWPKPALSEYYPSSRSVLAANGDLLRLTLASDQQYRLWTPLEQIARPVQESVVLYEDKWFYWHPGINPWALVRASVATATGKRRIGGSTLTMQLARKLYDIDSRSVTGKLKQAGAAIWLELRYSKHDLIEAYLNLAPYGGNVEGVGAASLVYWHKPVSRLTVAEAINLAVIPQNPRKRLPSADLEKEPDALREARNRLARRWIARHPEDARFVDPGSLKLSFKNKESLPFNAPHLVEHVLRISDAREVLSSIDPKMQALTERILSDYVKARGNIGIQNASALLLDASTMQVKALVGSVDYNNADIDGQVNGVFGKRSPGSTLKPFIYALALDQGLIHSASIVKDAPSHFGAYSPENFDGRFTGPLTAQEALIRSRNVPAVALAARLNKPSLYDFLKMGGVQKMASEAHYGLALVLGGGEVTMEELAQLYATLANQGKWQVINYLLQEHEHRSPGLRLLSPEASFITLDMLRHAPRPDTFAPAHPAIAWKTGTSWGFRDAWTAGVFGRYVLVVWIGNFNGTGNPSFVGIEAAAPLFLRIVDALRVERLDPGEIVAAQPADLRRVEVCTASGDLPNADCPATSTAWFIAGKSPIKQSELHQTILIDTRTGQRACVPGPYTKPEVFEFWPSDMLAVFKRAGMPLRTPPPDLCANRGSGVKQEGANDAPRITAPLRGVTHILRVDKPEPIYLAADSSGDVSSLRWFVDQSYLGQVRSGETFAWTPPQAGRYVFRVVDDQGRADTRDVRIELAQ